MNDTTATEALLAALATATTPPPFKFCICTSVVPGVSVTVDYGGTRLTIAWAQILCAAPMVGSLCCVGVNGLDRFVLSTQQVWAHDTPHVYTGNPGTRSYTEINYGTGTVYRDRKWRYAEGSKVELDVMVRLGTSPSFGTAGDWMAMDVPVPCKLDLGDHRAQIEGVFRFGISGAFGGTHVGGSVHSGAIGDDLNASLIYFVPDGQVALANNYGNPWTNFHVHISYPV